MLKMGSKDFKVEIKWRKYNEMEMGLGKQPSGREARKDCPRFGPKGEGILHLYEGGIIKP